MAKSQTGSAVNGDGSAMFTNARVIEQIVWSMKQSDYARSADRARIVALANGAPPYTAEDEAANNIEVNVNDLTMTRSLHEARLQLYQGFFKPGNFFTARTDAGAAHYRLERGVTFTREINRILHRSRDYVDSKRSKFAGMVLHGVGPAVWEKPSPWCPTPISMGDLMIPGRTYTTFRNLPFFAIHRSYTGHELRRLTRDVKIHNPGWDMEVVNSAIRWTDEQVVRLHTGTSWRDYWSPERAEERLKEDSGLYSSDVVPTIDCWDFYYWDDHGGHEGWRRRIIFDAEGGASAWGARKGQIMPDNNLIKGRDQFLFNSKNRVVASKLDEIFHCQFADLSAVAPFRYHSVRSLGFLLYAACHLQNRLRCKFSEAVFENLMMYMRVSSMSDAERTLKVELASRGFIPDGLSFLSPSERWQPDANMALAAIADQRQIISENSSAWTQNQNWSRDRVEKTKFQVMAEVNSMQTLVSSALQLAYWQESFEYREIVRRFLRKGSTDPDVNAFQARCLSQKIPRKYLNPECWDIEPERVMGSGNKTLELAVSQQLMEWRTAYAPEAQKEIVRMATLAITDDAAKTDALVKRNETISDDRHQAMLAFGSILAGGLVEFTENQNRLVIAQTLLTELSIEVSAVIRGGGTTTPERARGLFNVSHHIARVIEEIAQDKSQKAVVKAMADTAGKLANAIKGIAQRTAEREESQDAGNGEAAKLQMELAKMQMQLEHQQAMAETKLENMKTSHAVRTAQRIGQRELEQEREESEFSQKQRHKAADAAVDMQIKAGEAALDMTTQAARGAQPATDESS